MKEEVSLSVLLFRIPYCYSLTIIILDNVYKTIFLESAKRRDTMDSAERLQLRKVPSVTLRRVPNDETLRRVPNDETLRRVPSVRGR